jgi:hypothetical protein
VKTVLVRYASGTSNCFPSPEYTTQWPLVATKQHPSASFAPQEGRFLPNEAILCYFFAS